MIAFYIVGWFVWNPQPDERGYLRALHKSAPVVFLDHTEPEMVSIGFQICQSLFRKAAFRQSVTVMSAHG